MWFAGFLLDNILFDLETSSWDIVSTKIYNKRDDFDFEIVDFLFLDADVLRSTSYGVYNEPKLKVATYTFLRLFRKYTLLLQNFNSIKKPRLF